MMCCFIFDFGPILIKRHPHLDITILIFGAHVVAKKTYANQYFEFKIDNTCVATRGGHHTMFSF